LENQKKTNTDVTYVSQEVSQQAFLGLNDTGYAFGSGGLISVFS
jgi:hypothetical protein